MQAYESLTILADTRHTYTCIHTNKYVYMHTDTTKKISNPLPKNTINKKKTLLYIQISQKHIHITYCIKDPRMYPLLPIPSFSSMVYSLSFLPCLPMHTKTHLIAGSKLSSHPFSYPFLVPFCFHGEEKNKSKIFTSAVL